MSATVTDLFCGAGGSSEGATQAGLTVVMAANHWQTAIDVHQTNHPDTGHDCADISQVDPRRYPRTNLLLASPECTNHSQARGVSRRYQDPSLFDAPDPAAERSRATMWDVVRFAEQLRYDAIVVENVVEATKWVLWPAWISAMQALGYEHRVLSHNSMHHGVPQSRDRIYVVWWRKGLNPDLELELRAWCSRCAGERVVRQAWKIGRSVGRYRQQWVWACTSCATTCEPSTEPAASIIDWELTCPRIGDRTRPLAAATRSRILAGLQRYGWAPITTGGAGNAHERTPGNRARPLTEPLPVQHPTVCASDDRQALVPANNFANVPTHVGEPLPTATTGNRHGVIVPLRNHGVAEATTGPLQTVTAGGNHHALLMPYYGTGQAQPTGRPVTSAELDALVDDCGFRMLEPYEIAAAMAFPDGYIPRDLTKKDQVKLAGNAVTPPVMAWITGRLLQALEAA